MSVGFQLAGRFQVVSRLYSGGFAMSFFLLVSFSVHGQIQTQTQTGSMTFKTGPMPKWVNPVDVPESSMNGGEQASGGEELLLLDSQVNVAEAESHVHVSKKVWTEAGLQTAANVQFGWDPSYQELTIHQITIHRGTNQFDRLEPAKFKIIQKETDLESQVYNGSLSAVLFVEDVRVGDELEYSYTLRGFNPCLKGRYEGSFLLGLPMPAARRNIRIVAPENRKLNFRVHESALQPEVRSHDGVTEYTWSTNALPAIVVEDQVPDWYNPYPWVEL